LRRSRECKIEEYLSIELASNSKPMQNNSKPIRRLKPIERPAEEATIE
jgi:hypothetical protein